MQLSISTTTSSLKLVLQQHRGHSRLLVKMTTSLGFEATITPAILGALDISPASKRFIADKPEKPVEDKPRGRWVSEDLISSIFGHLGSANPLLAFQF